TPAAANRVKADERRAENDQTGRLWYRRSLKELSADFPARVGRGVDVEIGHSGVDPIDQRGFGLREPALGRNEGRVVYERLREIEDCGGVSPGCHCRS